MSALLPVAVYGLEVPAGDVMVPAVPDFPATFRITMAAIDPSAPPQHTSTANGDAPARATLKIIRHPLDMVDENDDSGGDSDEEDYLSALLGGADDKDDEEDDESSSDDEEKNGGPSDPTKTKKARKEAAVEQLKKALAESNDDDDIELDLVNGSNGVISKGKAKATDEAEDDENDDEDLELEEFVICTLDPTKNYQQALDLTVAENERVFFKVSGTHAIYLTGNYVIPAEDGHNHQHKIYDGEDDEDEDYDLSPDEDELDSDEESDELDGLGDPRITELGSDDEEEAPKLIKKEKATKKGKNKRAAEESDDEPANLDDQIAESLKPAKPVKAAEPAANGEAKLSKKQLKKLKNNAGEAVTAAVEKKNVGEAVTAAVEKKNVGEAVTAAVGKKNAKKDENAAVDSPSTKGDKKVQFAQKLEQGPSGETKADGKNEGGKATGSLGVKVVDGVKIDDKKLGKGPAAKKNDRVGMRYIAKFKDGKVFDSNKKGKPFTFYLGRGEVIKGWDIGVAGLAVGGERRIVVPAHLAYGDKASPTIPANSELTFDLKLIEIR